MNKTNRISALVEPASLVIRNNLMLSIAEELQGKNRRCHGRIREGFIA